MKNILNEPVKFFVASTLITLFIIEYFQLDNYLPGIFDVALYIGGFLSVSSIFFTLIMWLDPKSEYNRSPKRLYTKKYFEMREQEKISKQFTEDLKEYLNNN